MKTNYDNLSKARQGATNRINTLGVINWKNWYLHKKCRNWESSVWC